MLYIVFSQILNPNLGELCKGSGRTIHSILRHQLVVLTTSNSKKVKNVRNLKLGTKVHSHMYFQKISLLDQGPLNVANANIFFLQKKSCIFW